MVAAPALGGDRLSILFLGDVYLGETFAGGRRAAATHGHLHGFRGLEDRLGRADLVLANLEAPLTRRTRSHLEGRKRFVHRGDPGRTCEALVGARVSAVSLANNHAMDFGAEGLTDTLEALAARGIEAFGAGGDALAAGEPLVRRLRLGEGILELVVAAGFQWDAAHRDLGFHAGPGPGVVAWTPASGRSTMQRLRTRHPGALLVAFPHWGENYAPAGPGQRALARALAEGGADLVVGHGAHVAQEVERIGETVVVHGLGNGVFQSPGRFRQFGVEPFSLLAELRVVEGAYGRRAGVVLTPIASDNEATGYQPRPAVEAERDRVETLVRGSAGRLVAGRYLVPMEWGRRIPGATVGPSP